MFPIRITTLLTEEVYTRFSWAILMRRKSFIVYIIVILALILYPMIMSAEGKDIIFIALFTILVLLLVVFFTLRFRIKRTYRKNPLWQNMEVTLIFDREAFIARNIRGEFHYTYDDIVKVIMTKQDFYILIGESTGFAIEKENCSPEAFEFLLELHIEHM
ncbi:hypothetical protein HMPREF9383_0037 [Streptococcus sanguinis SK150]|mgnify:FL=1|uniref:YcxB-like C-terminal domain-containing protein n=2 Tax=Streptococcus sanguinis TaxID=1305 RepID=F0IIT5_STRSA|nr:YcxB family protein [Streptococcus sanguinis]MBF1690909.1 YcxB family protein [Streptococcus cristatus]EGD37716.1 hypothetical protein HMPREF9383_0037 [Streptococcus sanguinis SK150]MBZ2058522.1 YcxB family protein [Streptococcus sanguinis]MCY7034753.1 YcxB family protein [Streptococcus sanguinis]RSI02839.1 hypothetical protein D8890_10165 [Streptococcus sanguinis]